MQYDEKYGYEGEMTLLKCEELQSVYIDRTGDWVRSDNNTGKFCLKDEVNAAITELKEAWQSKHNACEILKKELEDTRMRERRLRRALWLARANSAEGQFFYWCARFGVESGFTKADIRGYSVNTKGRLRTVGEWIETWKNVRRKCRAKAEEYK